MTKLANDKYTDSALRGVIRDEMMSTLTSIAMAFGDDGVDMAVALADSAAVAAKTKAATIRAERAAHRAAVATARDSSDGEPRMRAPWEIAEWARK